MVMPMANDLVAQYVLSLVMDDFKDLCVNLAKRSYVHVRISYNESITPDLNSVRYKQSVVVDDSLFICVNDFVVLKISYLYIDVSTDQSARSGILEHSSFALIDAINSFYNSEFPEWFTGLF